MIFLICNGCNTSPFIGVIGAHVYTSIMELLLQVLQGGLRTQQDAEKGRKHYFKNELHLRDRVDLNSCHSGGIVPIRHVAYKNKRKKND